MNGLSLAGLRYRRVYASEGGPIESVVTCEVRIGGRSFVQANARLRPELRAGIPKTVWGDCDGSGTHRSAAVAAHMAISEALERWAHTAILQSSRPGEYGFDLDPTSTGMAAFPGWFGRQARRAARLEATERFALFSWWEGRLDGTLMETDWPGIRAVVIPCEEGGFVAIAFARTSKGVYAYGHAAAEQLGDACFKAMVELHRHESAILNWMANPARIAPTRLFERRALFFASKAGWQAFHGRLRRRRWLPTAAWENICDREIPGPWSRFATVWRYAYRPPSGQFIGDSERYFFF